MALTFLITALAAYRVTRIITTDQITEGPREWFLRYFPPDPEHAVLNRSRVTLPTGRTITVWRHGSQRKISKLGILISCPWCVGFWVSGLTVAVMANCTNVPQPLAWWAAVSAVVGLVARNLDA